MIEKSCHFGHCGSPSGERAQRFRRMRDGFLSLFPLIQRYNVWDVALFAQMAHYPGGQVSTESTKSPNTFDPSLLYGSIRWHTVSLCSDSLETGRFRCRIADQMSRSEWKHRRVILIRSDSLGEKWCNRVSVKLWFPREFNGDFYSGLTVATLYPETGVRMQSNSRTRAALIILIITL